MRKRKGFIRISKDQRPPYHPFYGDSFERGLDPFHKDAVPVEFKDSPAFSSGKRKEGWFLLDAYGNQIMFYPDGLELRTKGVGR